MGLFLFLRETLRTASLLTAKSFYSLNLPLLLLAVLLSVPAYFFQILSWNMIMRYLGVSLSMRQSIQGYPLTFLARYIPGSIWGYWSRSEWLRESCNISYVTSLSASVLEVVLFLLAAASITIFGVSFQLSGLMRTTARLTTGILIILTGLGIPWISHRMGGCLPQAAYNNNKYWYQAVVFAGVPLCLHGGTLFLISKAIWTTSSLDSMGAVYATSLSWLLGFVLIFIPAGIGVRETALSYLLIKYFGFPTGLASLAAVTFRFVQVLTEAEWLLLGLLLTSWHPRKET
ncbi:MAG: lysylphosphatidylglycerol synthase transmembrane domain-containing protein [Candidatus Bathyarchaeia archaeon]